MLPTAESYLKRVYYDPEHPAAFGGLEAVFRAAVKDGVDVKKKEINQWLREQPTYTLHKPIRRHFKRNRVEVHGIDHQWQADLVDMSSLKEYNRGYRYLLTCIDVFSKYAWAVPLEDKTGATLVKAFNNILKGKRKPRLLQTDKGTEFLNKKFQSLLKKKNIHFFTTNNETKASIVERFNRTLKTKMWKYFTANNTYAFLKVLPKLLSAYNHSFHRSIQSTPASVNPSNVDQIRRALYATDSKFGTAVFRFKVGDRVRISMAARPFRKGYLPNWTTEMFTITARIPRKPPVYTLSDYEGEPLEGTFYEQELQHVVKKDDLYKVEKVLQSRKRRGHTEYFVKWVGYPEKFNSWVSELHSL